MVYFSSVGLLTYPGNPNDLDQNGILDIGELEQIASIADEKCTIDSNVISAAFKQKQDVQEMAYVFSQLGRPVQDKFFYSAFCSPEKMMGFLTALGGTHAIDMAYADRLRNQGAKVTYEDGYFTISGQNIVLGDGPMLNSGTVWLRDKQFYFGNGKRAVINGLDITATNRRMYPIYFDGEAKADAGYVSMNPTTKKIVLSLHSNKNTDLIMVNFTGDNPFVSIGKRGKFEVRTNTASVAIEGRWGLIPKVSIKETRNGAAGVLIISGTHYFRNQYPFFYAPFRDSKGIFFTTAPCEIEAVNQNGERKHLDIGGLGLMPGDSLIVNAYGQLGILSEDGSTRPAMNFEPHPISLEGERNVYTMDYAEAMATGLGKPGTKPPDIKISVDDKDLESPAAKRIADLLGTLSPEMLKGIKFIHLHSDVKRFHEEGKRGEALGDGMGYISFYLGQLDLSTFQHEAAHILTHALVDAQKLELETILPNLNGVETNIGRKRYTFDNEKVYIRSIHPDTNDGKPYNQMYVYYDGRIEYVHGEKIRRRIAQNDKAFLNQTLIRLRRASDKIDRVVKEIQAKSGKKSFLQHWEAIGGDNYGKYVQDIGANQFKWTDWPYDMKEVAICPEINYVEGWPRHGFARPTGAASFNEDPPTLVEQFYRNPDIFGFKIDPRSAEYDVGYVKKLNLLVEYGYIDEHDIPGWMYGLLACLE